MTTSTLPPLDVVGPDGGRLTLRALARGDTVGALAERLEADALWTTRRELCPDETLADIDELRVGSRLLAREPARSRRATGFDGARVGSVVEVEFVSGPACAQPVTLGVGRHLVGRAGHATIRVDDPGVEAHHAMLRVGADGTATITQLTGAVPVLVDGRPLDETESIVGITWRIGASALRIRQVDQTVDRAAAVGGGSLAAHPADPWRRIVWRAPHDEPVWLGGAIAAPIPPREAARPSATGLIGAGVTALGAAGIAIAMGNPMFMLFAAMGVIATTVTFLVGVGSARRSRRRLRAEHVAAMHQFDQNVAELHRRRHRHHRAAHPGVDAAIHEALDGGTQLWRRRVASELRATVGRGTHRWAPPIEVRDEHALEPTMLRRVERCATLRDVAAPITVAPGDVVALHGTRAHGRAVARSIVAQLATWVGPADWQLVVVTSDIAAWSWADWLPHGALDGAAVVSASADELGERLDIVDVGRSTLLVTDEAHLFTSRTGALRRFLSASGAAAIVVVDSDETVPAACRRVLRLGSTGVASWTGDVPDNDDSVEIEFAGISVDLADEIARAMACLVDPEDDGGSGGGVPPTVSFSELMPHCATAPEQIAARWRAGGRDPAPVAPIGLSADGRIDIDLVRDGPHGLIAGTTGAGKSELLRTLVVSMSAAVGPQHLNFVLVDYKGGSTFDACTALPHTVGLVTDLDDGLAERALVSLDAELHRRERILRRVGAADLTDFRAHAGDDLETIARLVVVIDEFASLAKELPDFLAALVGIAQRGRSLGVHLLLATQRPAGVVSDDIRANTNLRLALRLHDRPDAIDVVGDELPATFPRGLPGRAALRLGPDELVVFQAARCTGAVVEWSDGLIIDRPTRHRELANPTSAKAATDATSADSPSELEVVVEAIIEAAELVGVTAPHRPWVEALPFPLAPTELADGAIGLIDDPQRQCRRMLTWTPADGSLALLGALGSGTTSTLISLAAAVCGAQGPEAVHLYVVDARGDDGLSALASLAHCGGVVRLTEDERLHRLLARVVESIDRRIAAPADMAADEPAILVMIDGYGSLRNALGAIERSATFDLLLRVVNDGPAAGVAIVVADDAGTAAASLAVSQKWIFHLDDPSAARGLGLRTAPVAPGLPGRFRIVSSGLEGQIARGAPELATLPTRDVVVGGGPQQISALADRVAAVTVLALDEECPRAPSDGVRLLVGLGGDDLEPAALWVPRGDHVLIVGGPRTGVSTGLARCVEAWERDADGRGGHYDIARVARRDTIDASLVGDASRRILLVVDDAHRVDDPDGVLASIARGDHHHVTLLAGARADAVRSAYGHWTREVAKCRCGIVMATRHDPDGDLLGVQLPRRPLIPARPGLGWIVDTAPLRQVQLAT